MSFIRASLTVLLTASLSATTGCIADTADTDAEADAIGEDPSLKNLAPNGPNGIVSGNGAALLTPELVALFTPLAKLLTLSGLSVGGLQKSKLLATLEGRTFLDYAIKCALPAGEGLKATFLGTEYTFEGHVGLAPQWLKSALSTSERRWLSACILAHVNAKAASVSILLAGDHPALASSEVPDEEGYTLREGAFYGDLFDLVPKKYACTGEGSVSERVCADGILGLSACGFTVPGPCRGAKKSACEKLTGHAYEDCHGGLIVPLVQTTNYPEVITVYLQP